MKKALLLTSLLALAAFAPAQKTYTLRVKAAQGQVFKYSMNVQSTGAGQAGSMGMNLAMKVAKVEKGKLTLHSTMSNMTQNGRPTPPEVTAQLSKILMISVMDDRGNVLKSEIKGMPGMPANQQSGSVPFPAKPIAVGGVWTSQADIQGQKVKTTYKLIAVKPVSGKMAAVIQATPVGIANYKPDGPIVFSVELANGFLISMKMSGTATQGSMSQKTVMEMRRL